MNRLAIALLACAGAVLGHTAESAGAPPAGVDPAFASLLQPEGVRIKDDATNVMELWFVKAAPSGPATTQMNVSLTNVPHGSFLGILRFTDKGADRRGQAIKPGIYTLRLGFFPPDGNHQGVAEQRDFLLMTPMAEDKDPKATPEFEALVAMSQKASGTAHPAVLSMWKADPSSFQPGVAKDGEHDWVLRHKIGDLPVAIIVAGTFDH